MLFGRLRILGKLGLLTLIPLLGVLALSVPIVVNRINVARSAQDTADAVALATQVGSTVQELQEERLLSIGYLFGLVQAPELVTQSAKAQERLGQLTRLDKPLSTAMSRAVANAAKLNVTRASVLNRSARPDLVINDFTDSITPIISALELAGRADLTTAVGRQVFALDQSLRADDKISQASSYLTSAVVTQNATFIGMFYSILIQLQATITPGQLFFTDAQYKLYVGAQGAFASRVGAEFLTKAATDPSTAVKLLNKDSLFPALRSVSVLGGFVEKRIAADVNAVVTQNRNDAIRIAYLVGGGTLLLLLIVISLSAFVARAVARPLRRLTSSADRVARAAETELERVADDETESARPIRLDPVDVEARDEIGDLARAFDRVQVTAARLVERQVVGRRNVAQMFGHVGRRTQNLVGRQLALIDSLERRETDSDRLRELYRLDHMSSRLRRNASSLVVLSGGAGTNEHMAPLPLEDVTRLALGEIEDYTRIDLDVSEDIVVVPSLVADLTLLLAELMENATSFSPPHTRVVVKAGELRGGARLAVVDQGLGLAPERLAEENARLTRRERLDLAPTEVLGLFVVGRLARRHGVEVTLTDTPEGGLTAWVDLRPQHLVSRIDTIAPATPIQATIGHPAEFTPLIAGGSARSVPGSAQPFDANVLSLATRTLESARSWNAFAVRSGPPAIEASPSSYRGRSAVRSAPVYDAEPVFEGRPYDSGTPVAGRHPVALPELPVAHPTTGQYAGTQAPVVMEGPIVMPGRSELIQLPSQRTPAALDQGTPPGHPPNGTAAPSALRRRVPGGQLPAETGPKLPAKPPTADDALAARKAFDAFEEGVNRAQWDAIEADLSAPPAAGPPLARRVPGASMPVSDPMPAVPPIGTAQPMDPEAARAMVEQFEYGVALALNESQSQHEGQPR